MKTNTHDWDALETKAMALAGHWFDGVKDKGGQPYIAHVRRVAEGCASPAGRVVGWLHDLLEDTAIPFKDISEVFPPEVTLAVVALTRLKGEVYLTDFIPRIALNPLAVEVKLSDLRDNSDLSRPFANPDMVAKRYKPAIALLEKGLGL